MQLVCNRKCSCRLLNLQWFTLEIYTHRFMLLGKTSRFWLVLEHSVLLLLRPVIPNHPHPQFYWTKTPGSLHHYLCWSGFLGSCSLGTSGLPKAGYHWDSWVIHWASIPQSQKVGCDCNFFSYFKFLLLLRNLMSLVAGHFPCSLPPNGPSPINTCLQQFLLEATNYPQLSRIIQMYCTSLLSPSILC